MAYTTVKYPFVDWTHQILISDGLSNNSTAGFPELTALEQAFRPFINIKYLIDRIFQDTEFTFESAFFGSTDFKRLYMDFNWGDARTPMVFNNTTTATLSSTSYGIGTFNVNFLGITNSNFGYDTSTDIFTAIADNQLYNVSCSIEFDITSFSSFAALIASFNSFKLENVRIYYSSYFEYHITSTKTHISSYSA
jgi:hypothetical protein